jgi:hypothetical protein
MKKILSLFVLSFVLFGCGTTPNNVNQIQASNFYGKWQGIVQHKDGYDVLVMYEFLPSSSDNTISVVYYEGFPDTGKFNFQAERTFIFTNNTITWIYDRTTQTLYNRATESQKYTLSETEFELLSSPTKNMLVGKLTLIERYNVKTNPQSEDFAGAWILTAERDGQIYEFPFLESNTVTKFEGRWVNEYALTLGYTEFSFTFTGNKMLFRAVNNNGQSNRSGTFTFTDTEITFIPEQANTWQGYIQKYRLIDNVLTLENDGRNFSGRFIKQ